MKVNFEMYSGLGLRFDRKHLIVNLCEKVGKMKGESGGLTDEKTGTLLPWPETKKSGKVRDSEKMRNLFLEDQSKDWSAWKNSDQLGVRYN